MRKYFLLIILMAMILLIFRKNTENFNWVSDPAGEVRKMIGSVTNPIKKTIDDLPNKIKKDVVDPALKPINEFIKSVKNIRIERK